MQKRKRYLIVTRGATGGIELFPLKEWLRQHPEDVPPGLSADSNSHQLRDSLKKRGYAINETDDEVRIIRPDIANDPNTVSVLGETSEEEPALATAEQFEFALESHLRDFIARNLATLPIPNRRLKLLDDKNGEGIEYPTAVGFIDLLAVDEHGDFVVFELKLSRGPDKAMGQLLRYMGWVKKTLAGERQVHGIIVAKEMDEKLRYASILVPHVTLLEYEVNFVLRPADLSKL